MDTSLSGSVSTTSRSELFLGLLPFMVLGTTATLMEAPGPVASTQEPAAQFIGYVLFFIGYLLILAALLWAFVKGFPRWSMPYLVYGAIYALYMANVSTPGMVIFNIPLWGRQLWGLRAWAPVGLVALLGMLLSRPPWRPVAQLFKNIWNDWTYLAFGFYGLLPMIAPILQDEMEHTYTLWTTLAAALIALAGAALYLIYARKPFRAAFLLVALFLAIIVVMVGTNYYWETHSVNFSTGESTLLTGPVPWGQIALTAFYTAGTMTLILALTGVVGLLRSWVGREDRLIPR
jgi:hypothetical protein